jgi:hypothetical protein
MIDRFLLLLKEMAISAQPLRFNRQSEQGSRHLHTEFDEKKGARRQQRTRA